MRGRKSRRRYLGLVARGLTCALCLERHDRGDTGPDGNDLPRCDRAGGAEGNGLFLVIDRESRPAGGRVVMTADWKPPAL
jgi:hypothetical protein